MRCASNGRSLTLRSASTIGTPMVRFGTKWLSMTSMWTPSADSMRPTSRPMSAKSALRMLGVMRTVMTPA